MLRVLILGSYMGSFNMDLDLLQGVLMYEPLGRIGDTGYIRGI